MSTIKTTAATAVILLAASASAAAAPGERHTRTTEHGTVVHMPASNGDTAALALPPNDMTMKRVAARYGQPKRRHAAVGKPPITRWDYPDFSVFFEYNRVINAVVPGHLPPLHHRHQLLGSD